MLLITAIIFKLHIYTIHFYIFFSYCPPDNILETEKRCIKRNKY